MHLYADYFTVFDHNSNEFSFFYETALFSFNVHLVALLFIDEIKLLHCLDMCIMSCSTTVQKYDVLIFVSFFGVRYSERIFLFLVCDALQFFQDVENVEYVQLKRIGCVLHRC